MVPSTAVKSFNGEPALAAGHGLDMCPVAHMETKGLTLWNKYAEPYVGRYGTVEAMVDCVNADDLFRRDSTLSQHRAAMEGGLATLASCKWPGVLVRFEAPEQGTVSRIWFPAHLLLGAHDSAMPTNRLSPAFEQAVVPRGLCYIAPVAVARQASVSTMGAVLAEWSLDRARKLVLMAKASVPRNTSDAASPEALEKAAGDARQAALEECFGQMSPSSTVLATTFGPSMLATLLPFVAAAPKQVHAL